MMEYKSYVGKVEFDDEAGLFHGEVVNTRDVITFQGASVPELRSAFRESVDDYLAFCQQRGEEPDKPFSGQFVARISPQLHRQISTAATLDGKSLNAWVSEQLQKVLDGRSRGATESVSNAQHPARKSRRGLTAGKTRSTPKRRG